MSFPGGSVVKNLPASGVDAGLIPGSGRSPGEGNGNSHRYSCLENLMDRGVWQATVHGVARAGHDLATKHHHRHQGGPQNYFYRYHLKTSK